MFVTVDRKTKVVRVEGLTVNEACWLGYKFAKDNRTLTSEGRGWCVVAFDTRAEVPITGEIYNIPASWSSASYRISDIIKNPPSPSPVHTCPDCKCNAGAL